MGASVLISILITFLVIILVLYLVNLLRSTAYQANRACIVIIIGILYLLRSLALF